MTVLALVVVAAGVAALVLLNARLVRSARRRVVFDVPGGRITVQRPHLTAQEADEIRRRFRLARLDPNTTLPLPSAADPVMRLAPADLDHLLAETSKTYRIHRVADIARQGAVR